MWEWIFRVLDNGGRNIQLDQAEYFDMGPLSGDSGFNMEAQTGKDVSEVCLSC